MTSSPADDDEAMAAALAGFSATPETSEQQPGIAVTGEQNDATRISGLKLELYSGSRDPQVYRDWRRSLEATRILTGLAPSRLAVLAWMSLRGEAKRLTRQLDIATLSAEDGTGLEKLLLVLDKRYLRQAHEQYDHCQREYERYRRHRGMTMNEYLTGLYAVKDELIAADAGTPISEMAYARKMLRSAGLTRQ